ncbi:HD domain-containing phosphohydrolase [Dyella psychrodurans]|uniref:LuxR family transcriptional regulator n=1 Tax=Dyella psychrodurans TaxID=1927960 RepID=A0A370X7J3_9GAMM|nr:HD domain-containing phosphohydrolase [Dyella psychrodurans]RDS84247.1 LuxR family transcriptional regulator [Dyella psychrodurans]
MSTLSEVPLLDAIRAIAFVGDLAMGQPTDHSWRTAWIASRLAREMDEGEDLRTEAFLVALLRWSGCTANAHEFTQAFGDDVAERKALLAIESAESAFKSHGKAFFSLSRIHCEIAGDVAALLGLGEAVQFALRHLFESFDGYGAPEGLSGNAVPPSVYLASIASDLEISSRLYGLDRACELVRKRADIQYPRHMVQLAIVHASSWFLELERVKMTDDVDGVRATGFERTAPLEILADVIDLKMPWMTGHSRLAATFARSAAKQLGLDKRTQDRLYRAGLIHGIGRAAVPNMIWDVPRALSESAWERVRLVPYWTGRAGRLLRSLEGDVELASLAYERSDGSGYYRGLVAGEIPLEARILAAAIAKAALSRPRPWRVALPADEVREFLYEESRKGHLDDVAVGALFPPSAQRPSLQPHVAATAASLLTEREKEVLRCISLGASNKAVALKLSISPSTVRTHVESVFRKLGCTTRAAATLKAAQLGLLDPMECQ